MRIIPEFYIHGMWQAKLMMMAIESITNHLHSFQRCTLYFFYKSLSRGHEFDTRHPHLPLCNLLAHSSLFQHILEPSHDKRMQYGAENTINSGNKTKVRGHVVQTILMSCREVKQRSSERSFPYKAPCHSFLTSLLVYLPTFRQLHEMRNEAVMV